MRRAGKICALAFLVSAVALAQASGAENPPAGSSPGEEIKQGFVSFGHGVRDGAVSFGHGVRDASVRAWGAVKSTFNGKGDASEKDKAPQKPSSASDGK